MTVLMPKAAPTGSSFRDLTLEKCTSQKSFYASVTARIMAFQSELYFNC